MPGTIRAESTQAESPAQEISSEDVTQRLMLASNMLARQGSLLQQSSNRTNFDYLFLRRADNTRYYEPVQNILQLYSEDSQLAVFSEMVHMYKPSLESVEMIILVTSAAIYLLDQDCNLVTRDELVDLSEIILANTNPSIFALTFRSGLYPLVLQSFRRPEFRIFVMSQLGGSSNKPKVTYSETFDVCLHSGKMIKMEFSECMQGKERVSSEKKRIYENSLLNNFLNANAHGHLYLCEKTGLFDAIQWTKVFVVLSNVGLLYFKDVLDPPIDFFPILNCELREVSPAEVDQNVNVFGLVFASKQVTFKCCSTQEYHDWIKAVQKLQVETQGWRMTILAQVGQRSLQS